METFGASISEVRNVATGNSNDGTVEMEGFKQRVDDIISKVDKASKVIKIIITQLCIMCIVVIC